MCGGQRLRLGLGHLYDRPRVCSVDLRATSVVLPADRAGVFPAAVSWVRIRGAERFAGVEGPLIVYANHGSWWDPMVSILLADRLMPGRKHYAPMDSVSLAQYPILRQVGIFGVEMESARGAVKFLRTGAGVIEAGGVMWITPQGRLSTRGSVR